MSGSQPRAALPPSSLGAYGNVLRYTWLSQPVGATGVQWVEARNAAKYPAMLRAATSAKDCPVWKVSSVEVEKLCSRGDVSRNPAGGWRQIGWGWALSEKRQSRGQGGSPRLSFRAVPFTMARASRRCYVMMPMATSLPLRTEIVLPTLWVFMAWCHLVTLLPCWILVLTLLTSQTLVSLRIWMFGSEAGKFKFFFCSIDLIRGDISSLG